MNEETEYKTGCAAEFSIKSIVLKERILLTISKISSKHPLTWLKPPLLEKPSE